MKDQNTKYQKGITLIALIITIVILLILAVVAIGAVKEDGIIGKAKYARDEYEKAQDKENSILQGYLSKIEENVSGSNVPKRVEDYGKKVEYSKGGVNDWKVFYNEGDTVYIIASDYLKNMRLPDKFTESMRVSDTHITYWEQQIDGRAVISSEVAKKYKLSWLANNSESLGNNNIKAVADLLDEEAWTSKFGNASQGIKAIGAPTLEMWVASWNAMGEKYGTDKYVKLYTTFDSTGYYIGKQENPTSSYYNVSGTDGYNDTLYFPYQAEIDYCDMYWLASPSSGWTVFSVGYNGDISYDNYWGGSGNGNGSAMRPLVSIPEKLLEEKADGSFRVKGEENHEPLDHLGEYVRYDVDGDGTIEDNEYESILWRVLRNDENKVELITADALGNVTLDATSFEAGRTSYNNAISVMVQECVRLTGISSVRNVGGLATDTTETIDFSELEGFMPNDGVDFSLYEGENGFKVGDNNWEEDYKQMKKVGILDTDNSNEYWFASRFAQVTPEVVYFYVRYTYPFGGIAENDWMWAVDSYASTDMSGPLHSHGVRPVLTLEAGILDEVLESGTKEEPIKIY